MATSKYDEFISALLKQTEIFYDALIAIREIAKERNYLSLDEALDDILDKIDEALESEEK